MLREVLEYQSMNPIDLSMVKTDVGTFAFVKRAHKTISFPTEQ